MHHGPTQCHRTLPHSTARLLPCCMLMLRFTQQTSLIEHSQGGALALMLAPFHPQQASLIGHSQGETLALMLLSQRPEYNDKVNINIGLGPVVYAKYATSDTLAAIGKAANVGTGS